LRYSNIRCGLASRFDVIGEIGEIGEHLQRRIAAALE
jgi:hypothetical protein